MKCEKCGKYEANYHYTSNINGRITEKHLCTKCAEETGENHDFFAETEKMFDEMFDGFFGRRTARFSPWGDFGLMPTMMSTLIPTMVLPRLEICYEEPEGKGKRAEKAEEDTTDPEMSKRRELNMLRRQMKKAAQEENYEKAAQLRDKIHEIEKTEG